MRNAALRPAKSMTRLTRAVKTAASLLALAAYVPAFVAATAVVAATFAVGGVIVWAARRSRGEDVALRTVLREVIPVTIEITRSPPRAAASPSDAPPPADAAADIREREGVPRSGRGGGPDHGLAPRDPEPEAGSPPPQEAPTVDRPDDADQAEQPGASPSPGG